MAHIIAQPCIGTKDTACVAVCPVDCIHPTKDEAELRRGGDAVHRPRHLHRLRPVRGRVPGDGHLPAGRPAGRVGRVHREEHGVLTRSRIPSRSGVPSNRIAVDYACRYNGGIASILTMVVFAVVALLSLAVATPRRCRRGPANDPPTTAAAATQPASQAGQQVLRGRAGQRDRSEGHRRLQGQDDRLLLQGLHRGVQEGPREVHERPEVSDAAPLRIRNHCRPGESVGPVSLAPRSRFTELFPSDRSAEADPTGPRNDPRARQRRACPNAAPRNNRQCRHRDDRPPRRRHGRVSALRVVGWTAPVRGPRQAGRRRCRACKVCT